MKGNEDLPQSCNKPVTTALARCATWKIVVSSALSLSALVLFLLFISNADVSGLASTTLGAVASASASRITFDVDKAAAEKARPQGQQAEEESGGKGVNAELELYKLAISTSSSNPPSHTGRADLSHPTDDIDLAIDAIAGVGGKPSHGSADFVASLKDSSSSVRPARRQLLQPSTGLCRDAIPFKYEGQPLLIHGSTINASSAVLPPIGNSFAVIARVAWYTFNSTYLQDEMVFEITASDDRRIDKNLRLYGSQDGSCNTLYGVGEAFGGGRDLLPRLEFTTLSQSATYYLAVYADPVETDSFDLSITKIDMSTCSQSVSSDHVNGGFYEIWATSMIAGAVFGSTYMYFQQLDPNCGILESVTLQVNVTIKADAAYESLEPYPSNVTLALGTHIHIYTWSSLMIDEPIFIMSPVYRLTDMAQPYDNTIDFAGLSGRHVSGVSFSTSYEETLNDFAVLGTFLSGRPGYARWLTLHAKYMPFVSVVGSVNAVSQGVVTTGLSCAVRYNLRRSIPQPPPECSQAVNDKGTVGGFIGSTGMRSEQFTSYIWLPRFDPACGSWESVTLAASGMVQGSAMYESLENTTTNITMTLSARIAISIPAYAGSDSVLMLRPSVNVSALASPFDRVIDYGGTSGGTFSNLAAVVTNQKTIRAGSTNGSASAFYGHSMLVSILVSGVSTSFISPGFNVTCDLKTNIGADLLLLYNVSRVPPPAPPPADDPVATNPSTCTEVDYDLSVDLLNVVHDDPACEFPNYLQDSETGCPSATCGVGRLDRPCCSCLEKLMQVLLTSRATSGALSMQALTECRSLTIGGCQVSSYLDAMRACTGTNVTSSPPLTSGVAELDAILAGGFLNPRRLSYSERGLGGIPASPALAVGPHHVITIVKSSFGRALYRVYVKDPWQQVKQSFLTQFHRSNTICRMGPFVGAPNTLYDHLADRWLIMELARNAASGGYYLCLLVSLSNVPYGLLYRGFAIALPGDPGEISISIMSDAYYLGTTENLPQVYALDRARYISGGGIRPMVRMQAPALPGQALQGLMPGNLAGSPRAGSACGLFGRAVDDELHSPLPDPGADFMEVWEMCPSLDNVTAAQLARVANVRISEFNASICGSSADTACFVQQGSATQLNTYQNGMPSRMSYRSFGDHESLLATFTVDGGSDKGAVMWVKLRRAIDSTSAALGPWEHLQDGVTPSDGRTRWLASATMDRSGDIALGYSVVDASSGMYPSLYYTGRGAFAPNGTMPSPETLLVAGTSASTSSSFGGRGGMAVDPMNGCRFYFQGPWEAMAGRSATYLGALDFTRCTDSAECVLNSDCDDGQFCTIDRCRDGRCVGEPDVLLCRYGEVCDEEADICRAT